MMKLPEMIYTSLKGEDYFGMRVFKNNFKRHSHNHEGMCESMNDIIQLEQASMNSVIKRNIFKEVTADYVKQFHIDKKWRNSTETLLERHAKLQH